MREVLVDLGVDRSYKIIIAAGILEETGRLLEKTTGQTRVMLISNPLVFSLYGERVVNALQDAGLREVIYKPHIINYRIEDQPARLSR